MMVAVLLALVAGVAVAKDFRGTPGNDTLKGTPQADTMKGFGGNDTLFGREGNDILQGGDGNDELRGQAGNDVIKGGTGNDKMYGNVGRDTFVAGSGNDVVFARGDGPDDIFCGPGFDVAHVSLNDLIGGSSVEEILSSVTSAEQDALSCEVLVVNGFRIPLGAIVALPRPEEVQVSLLLEDILRDGRITEDEITELNDLLDLLG